MPTLPQKPASAKETLDAHFLETRAKLLEIAANLDRLDRAPDLLAIRGDSRLRFIHDALAILQSPAPNRAEKILQLYSF